MIPVSISHLESPGSKWNLTLYTDAILFLHRLNIWDLWYDLGHLYNPIISQMCVNFSVIFLIFI